MSELQSLRTDSYNKQQQLRACTNDVAVLNSKVAQIDMVIQDLVQFKSELCDHRSEFKQLCDQMYDQWEGQLFKKHQQNMRSDLYTTVLKDYINKVDDNLDNLNNERMRLQNEIYDTEGLIGNIKSSINWLSTKISNLLN